MNPCRHPGEGDGGTTDQVERTGGDPVHGVGDLREELRPEPLPIAIRRALDRFVVADEERVALDRKAADALGGDEVAMGGLLDLHRSRPCVEENTVAAGRERDGEGLRGAERLGEGEASRRELEQGDKTVHRHLGVG